MVDEDDAVKVVHLVLDADGEELRAVKLEGLAVRILGAHAHVRRTLDVLVEPLEREASLLMILQLLARLDDLGVAENEQARLVFGDVYDDDALENADLVGREAHAGRLVHRLSHVGGETAQVVVKDLDGLGLRGEDGIGILDDGKLCHGRAPSRACGRTGARFRPAFGRQDPQGNSTRLKIIRLPKTPLK